MSETCGACGHELGTIDYFAEACRCGAPIEGRESIEAGREEPTTGGHDGDD